MGRFLGAGLLLLMTWGFFPPLYGCTIFVLTDQGRTLFCNNEDWSNPRARMWFVPGGEGFFGAVYVGFDDGWAQGGMNTEGLAYDWVAGFNDQWKAERGMKRVRGNSSQRMTETCSTVPEAIEFYRTHQEPSFARSRILIADRSGASVIIGYKEGKLHVEESRQCRGFGYGHETLEKELAKGPEPTERNGFRILAACRQDGEYATKYSNVFDLRSGEIVLSVPDEEGEVRLKLSDELRKGGHYFDLPEIRRELAGEPLPLSNDMKRFFIDEYRPLADQQPHLTKKVKAIMQAAIKGKSHQEDYTEALWREISGNQAAMQDDLKKLGALKKVTLVEQKEEDGKRGYRYRIDFKNAAVLQVFVFDAQDRIAFSQSEGVEWK